MSSLTQKIREFAQGLGFDLVGFAPVEPLSRHQQVLEAWLMAGYAGEMNYMARDPSRRANPQQILPEAKTMICLAMNYYPGDHPLTSDQTSVASDQKHSTGTWQLAPGHAGKISRYAWGRDYHGIIEKKLDRLAAYLQQEAGRPLKIRRYVDYGPVLERAFASRAGLGFIGKNTMLITQAFGSWVFLAELITDLDLECDASPGRSEMPTSLCGNCTLCIEACPTGAFVAPFVLDARRCISYLTIEHKGEVPVELQGAMEDWVFGCDVCQEVCPYNHQVPTAKDPDLSQDTGPWLDTDELLAMNPERFKEHFQDTPFLRPKYGGLQRNAKIVAKNLVRSKEGIPG